MPLILACHRQTRAVAATTFEIIPGSCIWLLLSVVKRHHATMLPGTGSAAGRLAMSDAQMPRFG